MVLRVLYDKPLHGYKLLQEVNTFLAGRRKLKPGSLYTILRRMEHSGLLDSIWEKKSEGIDRRIYNLTENGIEMLSARVRDVITAYNNELAREERAIYFPNDTPDTTLCLRNKILKEENRHIRL